MAVQAAETPLALAHEHGFTLTTSGCWEFNGYRNEDGYGQVRWGGRPGRLYRVHRLVYEAEYGPLAPGQVLRHRCDNPPCCNPDHLEPGQQFDNIRDMVIRGRHGKAGWTHGPNGHEYPPDRPAYIDKNRCRECARERNRRYKARKKAGR